jgi:hypothetical protein
VNETLHSPHDPASLPSSTPHGHTPSTPRDHTPSTPRDHPQSTPRDHTPSTPRDQSSRTRPTSTSLPFPSIPPYPTPTPAPTTPSVPTESAPTSKFNIQIPTNAKKVLAAFPFGKGKTDSTDFIPPDSTTALSSSPASTALPSTPTSQPFPTHSNLPSSPVPSPLYNNDPLYFLNKEAREISNKLFFHETIPVYLGRHRKNLFYFKLFSGELIEFCAPKQRHKIEAGEESEGEEGEGKGSRARQKKKMASSLYGDSLSGLVLLVSPDLSYKSETCSGTPSPHSSFPSPFTHRYTEFVNICGASTEFHFETFKKQLAKVKSANTRLNSGTYRVYLF